MNFVPREEEEDSKSYLLHYFYFFVIIIIIIIFIIFQGLSLCGAGAGGFAVVILKRNQNRADLFNALSTFTSTSKSTSNSRSKRNERNEGNVVGNSDNKSSFNSFNNELSIYSVVIDTKGISTKEFNDSENSEDGANIGRKDLIDYLFLWCKESQFFFNSFRTNLNKISSVKIS